MNIHKVLYPFLKYFRTKRMKQFEGMFNIDKGTSILDVGGSQFNWQLLKSKPIVKILNLEKPKNWVDNIQFEFVTGDATNLAFENDSFEIVYSNSVIEHLYSFENQKKMAKEVLRVGKNIYVQTPAKAFFIEPHLITPFIHWFPLSLQKKLMRNFTIWGLITRPTPEYINGFLKERRLLTLKEFDQLFSDCEIIIERFLFIPKSYIAIKNTKQAMS